MLAVATQEIKIVVIGRIITVQQDPRTFQEALGSSAWSIG
jgi:3-keto-L-gulonate-6-phosphate decarboxylase